MNASERRRAVRERYGNVAMAAAPGAVAAPTAGPADGTSAPTAAPCCGPEGCAPIPAAEDGGAATDALAGLDSAAGGLTALDAAASIGLAIGYREDDLDTVPDGANLGLGCGNPVALASLRPGETVLDLGSGAGFDCFLAAGRVGPEGRVIGVDMTPEMVERARENAVGGGFANVEFRLGEIEALPVADASVDAIISNCVLNLSGERERVFAEMMRVLRPGGRVMISDLVSDRPVPDFVAGSRHSLVGCLPVSVAEYEAGLAGAGFADVVVDPQRRYPSEHILADPQVRAVLRAAPDREPDLRAFVASIHGGAVSARKPGAGVRG